MAVAMAVAMLALAEPACAGLLTGGVQLLNSTWAQLQNESGNALTQIMAAPQDPSNPAIQEYPWNLWAILLACLLVLCPVMCCSCCLAAALPSGDFNVFQSDYELLASEETQHMNLGRAVRYNLYLMLLLPSLGILGAPWTTCAEGSPSWIYGLYVPCLLMSKVLEYRLMTQMGQDWSYSICLNFFLWGPLEHMDVFTDGSMPLQAWACESSGISQTLARSWAESSAFWVAPLVQNFHLWGLFLAIFAFSSWTQQFLGVAASAGPGKRSDHVLAADAGAMLALAEILEEDMAGMRLMVVGVSKVFLENILQLALQTSFLALIFDELTPLGRGKIIFSLALGFLSALQKTCKSLLAGLRNTRDVKSEDLICEYLGGAAILFFNLAAFGALSWTMLKFYHLFHCTSHLWNFGGCVPP